MTDQGVSSSNSENEWGAAYGLGANALTIILWLLFASIRWVPNAPKGDTAGPADGILFVFVYLPTSLVLLIAIIVVNIVWLSKIVVNGFTRNDWLPLAAWFVTFFAWIAALRITVSLLHG